MKKLYLLILLVLISIISIYLFISRDEVIVEQKDKIVESSESKVTEIEREYVFNPKEEVNYLDSAKMELPPIPPKDNLVHSWFATKKFDYSTNDYKPYIFNGMQFRMAYPPQYKKNNKKYPIVFILHGKGEMGEPYDNESQLFNGSRVHLQALEQKKFDGFIVYPQIPGAWYEPRYEILDLLIKSLSDSLDIDINRIVFHGLSLGGNGVVEMASKYPKNISAILPMSSVGGWKNIKDLVHIPIWVFQGKKDVLPSYTYTEYEIDRLISAGGSVKYTLYPKLGHNVWDTAYKEEGFFKYLSTAHKANPVPFKGITEFLKGNEIKTSVSITPGFKGYEWRRNGVLLENENENVLNINKTGVYDARILRDSIWSDWSLLPVNILMK
jgi:predicted peptidase